jgi:hypothetical protein
MVLVKKDLRRGPLGWLPNHGAQYPFAREFEEFEPALSVA